jgi:hypothetical protein
MEQDDAYRRAKQRAGAKFSFYIHLLVYIVVNAVLIFINFNTDRGYLWFPWPMFGWGIGLFFHGLGVFVRPKVMKQMIENELKKERDKKHL